MDESRCNWLKISAVLHICTCISDAIIGFHKGIGLVFGGYHICGDHDEEGDDGIDGDDNEDRPLSVTFLFRTSGKDSHSQAGSTRSDRQ